jgi:hypothetical protein
LSQIAERIALASQLKHTCAVNHLTEHGTMEQKTAQVVGRSNMIAEGLIMTLRRLDAGGTVDQPVRWTVRVSKDTDVAVRTFLAQRGMKKGDLAKFIEEAVRWRVLDQTVAETKARNAKASKSEINAAIDEALTVVRAERFAGRRG